MELMSYKTIRDLEQSLEDAAGTNDSRQLSIDGLLEQQKAEENADTEFPDSDFDEK